MQARSFGGELLRIAILGCVGVTLVSGYATFRIGRRDSAMTAGPWTRSW